MSDMEGASGIVAWSQVNGGAPMYEEGRRLYTEEINAAVRGARSARSSSSIATEPGVTGPSTRWCPSCWMRAAIGSPTTAGVAIRNCWSRVVTRR